ncbi:glycosyltransferase [Aliarcobacter cryaerophilus]|uniref:glycosyltransferase family 2 protein n=1 Tax=Aliarcobacter cryaerophilus TaxID=28198 RepID=UPI0021B4DA60|nr:glycosyltransferase [Aliarcobacter cryaerophilus]MCT7529555.1 glycosyltransferase [Aliarcobacter cryaerophilus]MCT7546504.1 glycosyltransferase [Aliarcobacter cryaerophilus]
MAKVSILMNGYNCEKHLNESINSIYSQDFTDWEIVFIDNCSTDSTKKIINEYDEKIKYYKTSKNIPLGEARNFGLQFCKGEYLAFLDTDDIWLKEKLKEQVSLMDLNKDLQMCYTGGYYIDYNSNKIGSFIPKARTGNVFEKQLLNYEINMQSVVIRNNIHLEFNKNMMFCPDYDLFMKIVFKYNVGVINKPLVEYRRYENSLTNLKIDRWWIEVKQTLDDIFDLNTDLKKKYKKGYTYAYSKVYYYKAAYFMSINKNKDAKKLMSQIKFNRIEYFILYIALLFNKKIWYLIHKYK